MNKFFLSSIIAMAVCVVSSSCNAEDMFVSTRELPQTAQTFLASHFPNTSVASTIKDGYDFPRDRPQLFLRIRKNRNNRLYL